MGNIVTCIKRVYEIQTPTGIKMEVESENPLSGVTTAKLLDEDRDIISFLENIKIIDVKVPLQEKEIRKSYKPKKKLKKRKKSILRREKERENKEREKEIPENKEKLEKASRLTPYERINLMITMEGEFTRPDYQKFMEEKGYKMSDFMGHGDIEDALLLKRISPTGEKIGRGLKKYRITDVMPLEMYTFRQALKSHKRKY